MSKKLFDVVVSTGKYTNNQGEEKSNFENVGVVLEGENGPYLLLKRTFNPAGVPNPDNKDSVLISLFEPKPKQEGQQGGYQQQPAQQQQQAQNNFQQPQGGFQQQGGYQHK